MHPSIALLALALVASACASPTSGLVSGPPDATASDGGQVADAGPSDASSPTPTGCFAGEVTLATATSGGGARAHIAPLLVLAREQGWVVFYAASGATWVQFLGPDGQVVREEPGFFPRGQLSFLLGNSLVSMGDFGIHRLDLGVDRVERAYPGVGLPVALSAAGPLRPGVVRAVGTFFVLGNIPTYLVTDVELSSTSPTGLSARSATLEGTDAVGALGAFRPQVRGELLQLLGTGALTQGPWRAVVLALNGEPTASSSSLGWSVQQDAPWGLAAPPESVLAQTEDGRWAVVQRSNSVQVEPLPVGGQLPRNVDSPALSVEARFRQLLDSDGRLSLLFHDRLLGVDGRTLAPLTDLRFEGGEPQAAQRADRAAVAYVVGDPEREVRLLLRCTALVD